MIHFFGGEGKRSSLAVFFRGELARNFREDKDSFKLFEIEIERFFFPVLRAQTKTKSK